jgi:two-component system, cell cycle sensor histidine kinase and response regulator CckA
MTSERTEHKRAEAALIESEEKFRAIFAQAAVGIAQTSVQGEWLLMNDRLCEILGYRQDELQGKTFLDITHPDDREANIVARRRFLAGEISSWSVEKRYIHKTGANVWAKVSVSLVRDQQDLPQYFISVVEDITDRIEAERALRDSERRVRLALGAGVGMWDYDLRGNAPTMSPQYVKAFGQAPSDKSEWFQLVHPDDRERVMARIRASVDSACEWDDEFRLLWPDGSVHWLFTKGTVLLGDDGRPVRVVGVSLDITDRKQAAAAVQESEERFRNMADSSPVMICACGPDERATFFNKACLDFTGRTLEEELGYGWTSNVHSDDREACLASYSTSFEARRNYRIECRLRRADGEYRSVICSGVPCFTSDGVFTGYVCSCVDITDVKRAQEEALARQKLESLGVLAGGIAHDFNNLLGGILAEAELIEMDLSSRSTLIDELHRIKASATRGAEIVRELMIYAGQDQASPIEPVDVSRLVAEMLELLKVSISKHAVLTTNLHNDLPAVWGSAPKIRQVVMNLLLNASEAIGEREGVIKITTAHVSVGNLAPNGEADLPEGDYVRLEVSDTGCGIAEEARTRIFDPFYTTKFAGRGLGLAVVQGIVRAHGGVINLASTPGEGTTFQVLLSCASARASAIQCVITPARTQQYFPRAGTILVVEDEEVLRHAISKVLARRGFLVLEACDGSAATELIRASGDDIDLVLLDVTLPGMSCREIFEQTQRDRPNLKIVLTSAYSKEIVDASFAGLRVEHFIRKPFQLGDLMNSLQALLCS